MMDVPGLEFWKYWRQQLASLKSEFYAITNKHPEAASIVQQVRRVLSDTEILAACTPAEVGTSSEWTSIVNSVEKRSTFIKVYMGSCFLAPFTAYTQ
jgi:hypothetical protein